MRITAAIVAAYAAGDDDRLRQLLDLAPWEESPLNLKDDDKSVYPPDTMGHKSCPKAKELQRAIEEILEKAPE
jgi:hypothetical protein